MRRKFFGASNSSDGFKNYFGECFERADRLFIIKGGPGTGKSSFMRKIAELSEACGYPTEHYFCSSDHTSYDGVLFSRGGKYTGLVDGTFPHPYIEKLPGLREEILNTGQFWDRDILCRSREEIMYLCASKSRYYDKAYSYLRACGNIRRVQNSYLSENVCSEKIANIAKRLTRSMPDGKTFSVIPAPINCIGMKGEAHFETFENEAEKIYILCGECGAGEFLSEIFESAKDKRLRLRVSPNPIYHRELDGVYFEDAGIWYVREGAVPRDTADRYFDKVKRVNMQKITCDSLEDCKREIKYCKKSVADCKAGAIDALARAGECHFALEEIYKSSMDFSALDAFAEKFCERLFS